MRLASLAAIAVLALSPAAFVASGTSMDSALDMQSKCGASPGAYPAGEYAAAIAAATASRDASGDDPNLRNFRNSVLSGLQSCQFEKSMLDFPNTGDRCKDLQEAFSRYADALVAANGAGTITSPGNSTDKRLDRVYSKLLGNAIDCADQMTKTCINLNSASAIDAALKNIALIQSLPGKELKLGVDQKTGRLGGELFVNRQSRLKAKKTARLRPCADTDWKCKKNTETCRNRLNSIKDYMDYYFQVSR